MIKRVKICFFNFCIIEQLNGMKWNKNINIYTDYKLQIIN